MKKKLLGILGGMGPEAGAYLFERVIAYTPAAADQDHLEVLLYSNPRVPDRTQGILGLGPSPEPELIRSVKVLEKGGVDCIIMACVTAHCYLASLRAAVQPPILSIIEETAEHLEKRLKGKTRIGLLATSGTLRTGIFQKELEKTSMQCVTLPGGLQERLVMKTIYGKKGIKAGYRDGRLKEALQRASEVLVARGAQVVLAGCTEIPLVLRQEDVRIPLVDVLDVLAERAVTFCLGRVK